MGGLLVSSEVGRLREVLMHVPGQEVSIVNESNYRRYLFRSPVNLEEARREVEGLMEVYRKEGVQVHTVEGLTDKPNAMYARDPFFMGPSGAIISRFMYEVRRGEERAFKDKIEGLGYPIVKVMEDDEVFEGGNAMMLSPKVAIAGVGERTNRKGLWSFIETVKSMGVEEVVEVQVPINVIHIDEYIAQVDVGTIVTVRQMFPWEAMDRLQRLGFNVLPIEYSQLPGGVSARLCLNMVALRPLKVVMGAGCDPVRKALESEGVDVIEVKVDEVLKGGGGVHCLTGVLRRDQVSES
jgi:N-dimethylarginine dimethylaminohydrolase